MALIRIPTTGSSHPQKLVWLAVGDVPLDRVTVDLQAKAWGIGQLDAAVMHLPWRQCRRTRCLTSGIHADLYDQSILYATDTVRANVRAAVGRDGQPVRRGVGCDLSPLGDAAAVERVGLDDVTRSSVDHVAERIERAHVLAGR